MDALLYEFVIIAILSMAVIFVCRKFNIPPIVGFLLTGACFGPSALGLVQEMDAVQNMADIGVVFLLFSIGMELSISELVRLKKPVFIGGTLQVAATIAVFALVGLIGGLAWNQAIMTGFLMALSSTAIVLSILQAQGRVTSPSGRISLAILIYQDLIIVPMMLAIPLLAGTTQFSGSDLLITAARTGGIAALLFVLARIVVPRLLALAIRLASHEIFLIAVLSVCLGTAYLTSLLGLSLTLGAFMAGLVVAESEFSHSALEGILPFKEVFSSLFFVSVGMLLDLGFFLEHLLPVALLTLMVLLLKALIAGGGVLLTGYTLRPAIIVGLALSQVGEFSFVLAKTALGAQLLTQNMYQLFLAVSILAMISTPFLIKASPFLADVVVRRLPLRRADVPDEPEQTQELSGHMIIIGYGPGGRMLARAAQQNHIPFVVMDMNANTVRFERAKGLPIRHGDAVHPLMLEQLGVRTAALLAVMITSPPSARGITDAARRMNKDLSIIVRTEFMSEFGPLRRLGATEVVTGEFETSLEVCTRVLRTFQAPVDAVESFAQAERAAVQAASAAA